MGTNRDPNWWWRLTPAARGIAALGAVLVLVIGGLAFSAAMAPAREPARISELEAEQNRRTANAPFVRSERGPVTVDQAYAHLDEAKIPRHLVDWRRRMAEAYVEMRGSGVPKDVAIESLLQLETDELAHRRNAAR